MFLAGKIVQKPAASGIAAWGAGTTWNPSDKSNHVSLSNGYLAAAGYDGWGAVRATASKTSGRYVFEVKLDAAAGVFGIGVGNSSMSLAGYPGYDANGIGWHANGNVYFNYALLTTLSPFVAGNVIGVVLDRDLNTLRFYKDGVLAGSVSCSALTGALFPAIYLGTGTAMFGNFGATSLAYTYP